MGWLDELLKSVPADRKSALQRAAGRERPNSTEAGPVDPGRAASSRRRIANRNMDELIGMCRMVLADGAVDDSECRFLLQWIESNYQAVQQWPGNVLYERIAKAMVDGKIDPDEESELLDVLHKISGGAPQADAPRVSGAIPFDDPAPSITFPSQSFVLTGQFVYGSRKLVSAAIEERGGIISSGCSKKTRYLVIGTFGSEEWLHSTHGTKIIKAVELKESGAGPAIVSERHWTEHL
jgi:hypothetical protein